jgi:phosphate:Na+ symporter
MNLKKMSKGINLFIALQLLIATVVFGTQLPASADSVVFDTAQDLATETSIENVEITSDVFHNVAAKPGSESAKFTWALDYNKVGYLKENGYTISIKYITAIGEKQYKAKIKGARWKQIDSIGLYQTSYTVENMNGGDKHVFSVGLTKDGETVWSEKEKFKTDRGWGIFKLLVLIGALGMFIFGMKIMSEGLQQAAGTRLRGLLGSITANRFSGVLTGFGITSIVQSSSVTTVMTVSFVNAGLLSLRQSAGVMMGANIGTTITAWLILIFGFKVSIGSYALVLIAIGAPFLFFGKKNMKYWGTAIVGFALLFMGLGELKEAVPSLDSDSTIVQFFVYYKDAGFFATLMFVGLGTLVTIIVQSSSAAMALTMTMVAGGIIPFEVAAAMILGENIGTTITAELASLIGNVHAKRSARIHSLFNIIGVTWAVIMFPFILDGIEAAMGSLGWGNPFDASDGQASNLGLAIFHTSFNFLNVLLLIGFVPRLVSLAERTVKSKGEADEEFKLDFIDGPLGSTADLCLMEAQKEVSKFGIVTSRMNVFADTLTNSSDPKEKNKMLTKIEKYEGITDRVEVEVATYLGKTATLEMSEGGSMQMRAMLSITNDLERIGDIYFQMGKAFEKKDDKNRYFTPEQREGLNQLNKLVSQAFEIMKVNLDSDYGTTSMERAREKEREINQLRNRLKKEHHSSMKNPEYNMQSAVIYSDLFSSYEKVGDHIINVSEAVAGEI